jgi:hypothetical protein
MFRNSKPKTVVVPLCALVAAFALTCNTAQAQVKPFKVTGGGFAAEGIPVTPNTPRPHDAVGHATHLGKYSCEGMVQLLAFTSTTTANFSSAVPCVFTAANGDKLAFHYGRTDFGAAAPGHVQLFDAGNGKVFSVWLAEFTPVTSASTGRFKKVADGSVLMLAITEPFVLGSNDPVAYTWHGAGWLEFE